MSVALVAVPDFLRVLRLDSSPPESWVFFSERVARELLQPLLVEFLRSGLVLARTPGGRPRSIFLRLEFEVDGWK